MKKKIFILSVVLLALVFVLNLNRDEKEKRLNNKALATDDSLVSPITKNDRPSSLPPKSSNRVLPSENSNGELTTSEHRSATSTVEEISDAQVESETNNKTNKSKVHFIEAWNQFRSEWGLKYLGDMTSPAENKVPDEQTISLPKITSSVEIKKGIYNIRGWYTSFTSERKKWSYYRVSFELNIEDDQLTAFNFREFDTWDKLDSYDGLKPVTTHSKNFLVLDGRSLADARKLDCNQVHFVIEDSLKENKDQEKIQLKGKFFCLKEKLKFLGLGSFVGLLKKE